MRNCQGRGDHSPSSDERHDQSRLTLDMRVSEGLGGASGVLGCCLRTSPLRGSPTKTSVCSALGRNMPGRGSGCACARKTNFPDNSDFTSFEEFLKTMRPLRFWLTTDYCPAALPREREREREPSGWAVPRRRPPAPGRPLRRAQPHRENHQDGPSEAASSLADEAATKAQKQSWGRSCVRRNALPRSPRSRVPRVRSPGLHTHSSDLLRASRRQRSPRTPTVRRQPGCSGPSPARARLPGRAPAWRRLPGHPGPPSAARARSRGRGLLGLPDFGDVGGGP